MSNYLKNVSMVPLESVIGRVLEVLPKDSISEDKLEEWAYESYESLAPREVWEVHIEPLIVYNSRATLPSGIFKLEMVLYKSDAVDDSFDRFILTKNSTTEITTSTDLITGETTNTKIETTLTTNSNVTLKTDKSIPLYNSNSDNDYNITKDQLYRFNTSNSFNTWKPLPLSNNIFHKVHGMSNIPNDVYKGCNHSFSIHNGCMTTSFDRGYVVIAYVGIPKQDGKWMIPDYEVIKKAIETYCLKKYWQWKMNMKEEGAYNLYKIYSSEYELLGPKATGQLMMPDLIQYQNLRNMNKFIKEDSAFSTVMGALNNTEIMDFNNLRDSFYRWFPFYYGGGRK